MESTQPVSGDPGVALFRLIRHWARRAPQRSAVVATGSARDVPRILVVEAVATAREQAGSVDVTAVARALGIDHSGASRMVSDAVQAGLLIRSTAAHDTRHAALLLTGEGEALVAAARKWQYEVFEEFTRDWSDEDRACFGRLLVRFCAAATAD
ncbi:MarR family winged helix-turn-helix transcriptional regulator [Dactylosporangium sucinum]|uniref:MarR family transcriptional regulator n=1 Tax=Dactylosporangium sucinum TaxID=1424081 RepID=A0A917X0H1_9ACTN|nr:MarR family winged helix-turn-helix transcriptional regulator [Dactylosporangium sucinum]GGM47409.1 MarR family transcriptional regulator [Dactylosporangium sucinum]